MGKNYRIRIVFRGFDDPRLPAVPKDEVVSDQSRPMDLPYLSDYSGLVLALDGKQIEASTVFANTKIQDGSLLLIIQPKSRKPIAPGWAPPIADPKPQFDPPKPPPTLYGCPSAADVEGLVPESMVQMFQGFETVDL